MIRIAIENSPEFYLNHIKPTWKITIIAQIFLLPYGFLKKMYEICVDWVKYQILNRQIDHQDKILYTCKALGIQNNFFVLMPEEEQNYYLDLELWHHQNLTKYMDSLRTLQRRKEAESGKTKAFKRFIKNGGFGRISFDD
ncbi:hypothetical protein HZS_1915 [Henneguya salminicola]|nr:hypothetical protein HZS_1915 [Henneguya salminicola]